MTDQTLPANRPLILIDLSAWPQVQTRLPATIPLPLVIAGLEATLAQLRELYIQAQVERRTKERLDDVR